MDSMTLPYITAHGEHQRSREFNLRHTHLFIMGASNKRISSAPPPSHPALHALTPNTVARKLRISLQRSVGTHCIVSQHTKSQHFTTHNMKFHHTTLDCQAFSCSRNATRVLFHTPTPLTSHPQTRGPLLTSHKPGAHFSLLTSGLTSHFGAHFSLLTSHRPRGSLLTDPGPTSHIHRPGAHFLQREERGSPLHVQPQRHTHGCNAVQQPWFIRNARA